MKTNINKLNDDEITAVFQEAVQKSIDENSKKGLPVCGFDEVKRQSYILYPDGRKEYAEA